MLTVAVVTENSLAADGIDQLTSETGLFNVVYKGSPKTLNIPAVLRALRTQDPDFILLDVGDWQEVAPLAGQIRESDFRAITIGFAPQWEAHEKFAFKDAGIEYLLREPFSAAEMEMLCYEALHKERAVTNRNILAFLPSKAGGGSSTIAIHTAAALARCAPKNVLLVETDRRSGVYSIMLGLENRLGLDDALGLGSSMTPVEWYQHVVRVSGFHLLPANPKHRRRLPTWADYYQLLRYVQKQYDFILVDLPEVVNEASAEVVRSARSIFVVCTPELASIKMAHFRAGELEACDIPGDRIHILINRAERGGSPREDLEEILERPVFGVLPNDYAELKQAMLESRLASPESPFAESCLNLARKLGGLPAAAPERSRFALLRKLSRLAG